MGGTIVMLAGGYALLLPSLLGHWADFINYYTAAQMVSSGDGYSLYDLSQQAAAQSRLVGPGHVLVTLALVWRRLDRQVACGLLALSLAIIEGLAASALLEYSDAVRVRIPLDPFAMILAIAVIIQVPQGFKSKLKNRKDPATLRPRW